MHQHQVEEQVPMTLLSENPLIFQQISITFTTILMETIPTMATTTMT